MIYVHREIILKYENNTPQSEGLFFAFCIKMCTIHIQKIKMMNKK